MRFLKPVSWAAPSKDLMPTHFVYYFLKPQVQLHFTSSFLFNDLNQILLKSSSVANQLHLYNRSDAGFLVVVGDGNHKCNST